MQFSDEGYIIKMRRHGESSLILTVLTRHNGKVVGYVKNCLHKKNLGIYQLGNSINLNAYARLEDNLYSFHVDLLRPDAVNFLSSPERLAALGALCELCNDCLPEKEDTESFFNIIDNFFKHILEDNWKTYYSYFEFYLLDYLGIGLDLSECSATGSRTDLKYVSPKSGKAVCASAGDPYKNRLFTYPRYIVEKNYFPGNNEIDNVLKMTEFFLNKNFFQLHGLKFPENRANLRDKLMNKHNFSDSGI